ncbi:MAG: EAL domain-containing protein, partial [Thiothrix sp.]
LNGEKFRAELRFIPAVLKGKRCTQLYVRPVERHIGKSVPLWKDNPWEHKIPTVQSLPATEVATQAPLGMRIAFHKLHRLKEKLPVLYVAEPLVQQQGQVRLDYAALLRQPDIAANRFRLDYWVIEQIVLKLSSQVREASSYLVFVSITETILNNEEQLTQLIGLLDANPAVAKRLVIATPYPANGGNHQAIKKLQTLLRGVGAFLAIDSWVMDANALQLLKDVKPLMVRFSPRVLAATLKTNQLPVLRGIVRRLVDSQCRVIITGIINEAAFRAAHATAASYAQGSYIAQ